MPTQTPGILWTYFQNAILMTIPVSAVLLVWYKRSVSRNMRASSEASRGVFTPEIDGAAIEDVAAPAVDAASTNLRQGGESSDTISNESRSRRRVAAIYAIGGAVAASILTALFFATGVEAAALRVFVVWFAFCWPIVPTVAALLAASRRRAIVMFGLYVVAGICITWVWSLVNKIALGRTAIVPSANVIAFLKFLLQEAWLPYLIILVTGNRRVRAVSPLALAGLLVFSFSALAVHFATIALIDTGAAGRWAIGVVGAHISSVLFLVAALPVGLACWWPLGLLGRGYERKSFSDLQLVIDSWWLIVVFNVVVLAASDLGWKAFAGLLAWVAYRIVVEILLRAWRVSADVEPAPRLLLLRVFGFQRRTEQLFDAVAQRWRFRGTATLIAGTDLVSRLIDPGDVISFVGGHLKQQFVQSSSDVTNQLRLLDHTRDPDGRFRVNKFFCHDNTWRATLNALMKRSDVVLMDLRGFSERNSGCQFELREIAANALLPTTVFVVDDSTDFKLLEASVIQTGPAATRTAHDGPSQLNLVHTKTQSGAEIRSIDRALRSCL
jgi:hypothetical protein